MIPVAVFIFDYRGYGKSEGAPDESGLYADAEGAYRWLAANGFPADRVVVYGESLGGAVAVELAARVPVAGLVVQSSFTSVSDMARRVMPLLPLGWLMKTKFASVDKVGSIKVPKLHFHGRPDEVVPFPLGRALFEAAAEPKRWVEYPDVGHNDWPGVRSGEWQGEIATFVKEVVK